MVVVVVAATRCREILNVRSIARSSSALQDLGGKKEGTFAAGRKEEGKGVVGPRREANELVLASLQA